VRVPFRPFIRTSPSRISASLKPEIVSPTDIRRPLITAACRSGEISTVCKTIPERGRDFPEPEAPMMLTNSPE